MTKSDALLASIRNGQPLTFRDKLSLIVGLSIPSILAQITSVMMFFIDAAMVGHLGTEASASIGLIESTTWLMGSITNAASMGFSVQVAHYIGANDFERARDVFRNGIVATAIVSFTIALTGLVIHPYLPYWLGGGSDIAPQASTYFLVFALTVPFFQLSGLCGNMLKCSGNMKIPSIVSVGVCVLDVLFNSIFIYVLGWGVMGAALGTSLAIISGTAVQGYYAIFRNRILSLRQDGRLWCWAGQYVRTALKIGSPMALQSVFLNGAQIVSTMIVAPLGNVAISANTFAITAESLCYMPGYGISEAATIKLGVAYRLDEVSDALRRVATTAHATESRHTRIVPSCHEVFVNEGVELTLRHHGVGKVQTVKLDLSRTEVVQVLCLATHLLQVVDEQIVERTVRHKLERTD